MDWGLTRLPTSCASLIHVILCLLPTDQDGYPETGGRIRLEILVLSHQG